MFKIDIKGTAYFNTAVVPRYKTNENGELFINFSWVEFEGKKLKHVSHRWYTDSGNLFEEKRFC